MRRWLFNVQLLLWVPSDHLWALPDPSHCCWSYPAIANSTDRNAPWGQRSLPWGPTDQPWGQTTPALRRSSSTGLRTTSTRGTDNHPSQRLKCWSAAQLFATAYQPIWQVGSAPVISCGWGDGWQGNHCSRFCESNTLPKMLYLWKYSKLHRNIPGGPKGQYPNIFVGHFGQQKIMWQQMTKFIARSCCGMHSLLEH